MKIKWNIIDIYLKGEMESDDCPPICKQEIAEFLQTHRMEVFSEESLEFLSAVWDLVYKASYEASTGEKIPNIFHVIQDVEEEPEQEEVIDERETLSSGI